MEIQKAATITKEELANQVTAFYRKECYERLGGFLNQDSYSISVFNEYTKIYSTRGTFLESTEETSDIMSYFMDKWCCHCSEKFFIDNENVMDVLLLVDSKENFTFKLYLATR